MSTPTQPAAHMDLPLTAVFEEDTYISGGWVLVSGDGQDIAMVIEKDHAEAICRAVNSHADLLAALDALCEYIPDAVSYSQALDRARAAIAKAKGQS